MGERGHRWSGQAALLGCCMFFSWVYKGACLSSHCILIVLASAEVNSGLQIGVTITVSETKKLKSDAALFTAKCLTPQPSLQSDSKSPGTTREWGG